MQSISLMFQKQLQNMQTGETYEIEKSPTKKLHEPFQLPIAYLEKTYELSPIVSSDLELTTSQSCTKSMYDTLFRPSHEFAKNMIPEWNAHFTDNVDYLKDTQKIIENMDAYSENTKSHYVMDTGECDKIMQIWNSAKEDETFMDRYSFIDWDMLKYLNESSNFLQGMSLLQIVSPLISLMLPFLFLLIPFLMLKFQGIPITFGNYLDILKTVASNHVIGKALMGMQGGMNAEKIAYLLLTFGFYAFQIYQNVNTCRRFYKNVRKINIHLYDLRNYLEASIRKMDVFARMHIDKSTYVDFCRTTKNYSNTLKEFFGELSAIQPFDHYLGKITEIGYMLKCFYRLHSNDVYDTALRYSFGFEGYIDNLAGVFENLADGNVHYASFSEKKSTRFVEQYYPPLLEQPEGKIVKNTCAFDKNMIVSAPNAAGKTTILKTTLINIIFSQQLGCGFYDSCVLNPYTHIHSYLNIPDTSGRDSLFQAESRRCKEIIDIVSDSDVKSRHFCIFDELYSGTNPTDAGKSAAAFLKYLGKFENVDFMLTTHYVYVCKKFKKSKKICNYKMGTLPNGANGFKMTYKLEPGISKIQGAIKILKDMNYPQEMIDTIENSRSG
jgi:hypothetical protein